MALVNCLNFGNPEHPEVMWQLSEAIDGMSEACTALGIPVIGGNVSLYNESRGRDIDPTPVVGTIGLVQHLEVPPPGIGLVTGSRIVVVAPPDAPVSLGGSRWAWDVHGERRGRLAPLDLAGHRLLLTLVAAVVNNGLVDGIHDVSDGGLAVALAEMAVHCGVGFRVGGLTSIADLFGEGPSRVVCSVPIADLDELTTRAATAGLAVVDLGVAGGTRLIIEGSMDLAIDEAGAAWRSALPQVLALG